MEKAVVLGIGVNKQSASEALSGGLRILCLPTLQCP